jgi:hypothetical protein
MKICLGKAWIAALASILLTLLIFNHSPEYSRVEFGKWIDADGDCQDTRQEILILYSSNYKLSDNGCKVVSGEWVSRYTGNIIYSAKELDLDHVVPLKWAWDHGAKHWTYQERVLFANDFDNLVPVEASLNRSKGSRMDWLPPYNRGWYQDKVKEVKLKYKLEESYEG